MTACNVRQRALWMLQNKIVSQKGERAEELAGRRKKLMCLICVAVQCKDWVEGVSWGKNKNQNSSLVPCHGKVLPSWWVTAVGCSLWLRRANGWLSKCCKFVLVEVLFRAIDRQ